MPELVEFIVSPCGCRVTKYHGGQLDDFQLLSTPEAADKWVEREQKVYEHRVPRVEVKVTRL
ncbi:hypothetical protein [Vibrio phage VP16C]|nr:hypothetical protein [Vibrio phage VP16C]